MLKVGKITGQKRKPFQIVICCNFVKREAINTIYEIAINNYY